MSASRLSIRTPDQRLRVFVSSTLGELAAERAAVRRAVEQLHLTPVLFELGARPHPPRDLYRAYLAQSDVFVGLYWERYGWIAPGEEVSGLEDELVLGAVLPSLLYVKHPAPDRDPRLDAMLARIEEEGRSSYRRFRDADELERLVGDDLAVLLSERFDGPSWDLDDPSPGGRSRPLGSPPPVPLTATIGRDRDLAHVRGLLHDGVRLLTLSGPGGIGKSRLALEVARTVQTSYPDGVVFVPLETVTDPDRLLATVRERLHLHNPNARPELDVLVDALAERRVLLLLDNVEQLVEAAPRLGEVLDRCPGVTALVTSRQVLRLRAEHEYAVPPLPREAAVALFEQRAAAARHGFEVTDANRRAIEELCRRLDGLPLALELAAARIRLLPPDSLLARLEQRLDVLTDGAADLPERQRTLRRTLDWSHRLLDAPEQVLLARLSVFSGGATIEAAEAVCGDDRVPDVVATLSSLLEKSLLVSVTGSAGPPRVSLLQVVREYAAERLAELGEADARRERHAAWFLELLVPADISHNDRAHEYWPKLEPEVDNVRAAADWALATRRLRVCVRLARRCWVWAWQSGRLRELAGWLEQALALADELGPSRDRGELATIACEVRLMLGDVEGAIALVDEAVAAALADGEPALVALARVSRVTTIAARQDMHAVLEAADDAVEAARVSGGAWAVGWTANVRGTCRLVAGDLAGARDDLERSLATATAIGLDALAAQSHGLLVWLHLHEAAARGDAAQDEEARDDAPRDDAALADARWHLDEVFGHLEGSGNLEGLGYALDAAAGLALADGHPEDAARALGAASAIRDRLGMPTWPLVVRLQGAFLAQVRDQLGEEATEALMAEAAGLDPWVVPAIVAPTTGRVDDPVASPAVELVASPGAPAPA